tara:strand:+ start:43 stop:303 length:261 start_codon:yes stop_codon:yes gene_type:complete
MGKLKLTSVLKTSTILVNAQPISREDIVVLSEDWTDSQVVFFKKIVRQGGTFSINGDKFDIKIGEKIIDSKGFKDPGAPKMYGPEE